MEIPHSAGRVGMRVRIPFSECSVTVTFIFGPKGAQWRRTCSGNHMFNCIHRPNHALQRTRPSRSGCNRTPSWAGSLSLGAFLGGRQVGFARVISDFASFAYVADVFVVPEHRGRGISKLLMRAIIEHPDLQGLRRILLATRDAHGLYAQFGFEPLTHPEAFMTLHKPDVYRDGNAA